MDDVGDEVLARRTADRARYLREAERRRAYAREYSSRPEVRERDRQLRQERIAADPEAHRKHKRELANAWYAKTREARRAKANADRAANPEKRKEWVRKRRKEAPHVFRSSWLRNKYGITQEEWDALFARQNERCAVCQTDDPRGKKGWHTDHCHDTGRVRGILCRVCNNALGMFKDDPELVQKAADYLRR